MIMNEHLYLIGLVRHERVHVWTCSLLSAAETENPLSLIKKSKILTKQ